MSNIIMRDCHIEVDLKTLEENTAKIEKMAGPETMVMAVVKANGYGHGIKEIIPALIRGGASYLGVATLGEALKIREVDKNTPVLILGQTPPEFSSVLVENNIIQTIFSLEQAESLELAAEEADTQATIHIKIDTGLHRLGFPPIESSLEIISRISEMKHLRMEGIFTHLALLNDEENYKQFEIFKEFLNKLSERGIVIPVRHMADSIASVDYPEFRMDMIRTGALIYGMRGFHKGFIDVNQALTLKAKIAQCHIIHPGEGVSYDYTFRAQRESVIATLPIGYADGIPRNLSNVGKVLVKKGDFSREAPIVGLINMDQMMIDVTHIDGIFQNYRDYDIYIYGQDDVISIKEIAKLAGTNKNDILARLSDRIPRIFI